MRIIRDFFNRYPVFFESKLSPPFGSRRISHHDLRTIVSFLAHLSFLPRTGSRGPTAHSSLVRARVVRGRQGRLRLLNRRGETHGQLEHRRAGHQRRMVARRRERMELHRRTCNRNEGRVPPRLHRPPQRKVSPLGPLCRSPQEDRTVSRRAGVYWQIRSCRLLVRYGREETADDAV